MIDIHPKLTKLNDDFEITVKLPSEVISKMGSLRTLSCNVKVWYILFRIILCVSYNLIFLLSYVLW